MMLLLRRASKFEIVGVDKVKTAEVRLAYSAIVYCNEEIQHH